MPANIIVVNGSLGFTVPDSAMPKIMALLEPYQCDLDEDEEPVDPDLDKYLERLVKAEEAIQRTTAQRAAAGVSGLELDMVNAYANTVTAICWVLATKDQLECECEDEPPCEHEWGLFPNPPEGGFQTVHAGCIKCGIRKETAE